MEDYKPNSNKYKKEAEAAKVDKNLKPVVNASAKVKQKSEGRKLLDVFVSEDVSNVKSYILMDVLVPAIKKAIDDIVSDGIHMILYGGRSSRSDRRPSASRISYSKFYESRDRRDDRDDAPRSPGLDYENIEFQDRGDAESVLSAMEDVIDQYGVVSVGDLYDLADISTTNYAINKYGWTDLRNARVERYRDVYILKLPKALPLN